MQSEDEAKLQYRIFADHRLHFSRLYFQLVAFMIFASLTSGLISALLNPGPRRWAVMGIGLVLALSGFVAHRLRAQEDVYAGLLRAIEEREGTAMLRAPFSARLGARTMVTAALVGTGLGLFGFAALRL